MVSLSQLPLLQKTLMEILYCACLHLPPLQFAPELYHDLGANHLRLRGLNPLVRSGPKERGSPTGDIPGFSSGAGGFWMK